MEDTIKIKVCVLGTNASGASEFSTATIKCSISEYKCGDHY